MREALEEFWVVLAYSTKTQIAILFGLGFFVGITAAGDYFTSRVVINGILAPLTDVIREKIAHQYDKVAWAALVSFFILAVRCYKKDHKRFFGP